MCAYYQKRPLDLMLLQSIIKAIKCQCPLLISFLHSFMETKARKKRILRCVTLSFAHCPLRVNSLTYFALRSLDGGIPP